MAETLAISRSSLYYQARPRASRADRSRDREIVLACGEKPAYGYRRVVWWLGRHHGLALNGKRVLRVMREHGLLVRQRRFQVSRRKDWGKVEALHPDCVWQSDMTKVWAGPSTGWSYLLSIIDCCTCEIVGWDLSLRCHTGEALPALEKAVLNRLPHGPRGLGLTLTTDNGNAIHFGALYRNPQPARHPASPHRLQSLRGETATSNASTAVSKKRRSGSMSARASTMHAGPSLFGSKNTITTVRTADSTAERRTNPVPRSRPQPLLQTWPNLSRSAGCTTSPS